VLLPCSLAPSLRPLPPFVLPPTHPPSPSPYPHPLTPTLTLTLTRARFLNFEEALVHCDHGAILGLLEDLHRFADGGPPAGTTLAPGVPPYLPYAQVGFPCGTHVTVPHHLTVSQGAGCVRNSRRVMMPAAILLHISTTGVEAVLFHRHPRQHSCKPAAAPCPPPACVQKRAEEEAARAELLRQQQHQQLLQEQALQVSGRRLLVWG